MKKGLIIVNGYTKLDSELNQSKRLQEEFKKIGVTTDILRNNGFFAFINSKGEIENTLSGYDFCVYLDKDKYISQMLEQSNLRIFNKHEAILNCDDKMLTFLTLANAGIEMPKTLSGLLCYTPFSKVQPEVINKIEEHLGYPMIVKACFGSLGKQVFKVDNRTELYFFAEQLKTKPHVFQEFIQTSEGRDIRVITIGGKVVASMLRKSETDFRSNIEVGGVGYPFEIDDDLKAKCEKIALILDLDFCGIDILFGENGYLVCEVNSNAFFGGIEKITGVNVAKAYAEHIYNKVYNSKEI